MLISFLQVVHQTADDWLIMLHTPKFYFHAQYESKIKIPRITAGNQAEFHHFESPNTESNKIDPWFPKNLSEN